MKVLLLPFDIASKGAITIDALNRMPGIEARGFFVNKNSKIAKSLSAEYFDSVSLKEHPLNWIRTYIKKYNRLRELIKWADVLHWIWDSGFAGDIDLRMAKYYNKRGIIEWSGSDIRYPERAHEVNPFAKYTYNDLYEFAHIETRKISYTRQQKFYEAGFKPLVTAEMDLYIRKDLFQNTYRTFHRLNVTDFKVKYSCNEVPLIVHSPTCRVGKGTKYILAAIEELKQKYNFEFRLIENISREKAFEFVKDCDIFIDQLLTGTYGMASCEAMSMGKPVICYMMESVFNNGMPRSCPVVNANIENIKEKIEFLLISKEERIKIGKLSRKYAENYLDINAQINNLISFYKNAIGV